MIKIIYISLTMKCISFIPTSEAIWNEDLIDWLLGIISYPSF
jgi:hypothetical protein